MPERTSGTEAQPWTSGSWTGGAEGQQRARTTETAASSYQPSRAHSFIPSETLWWLRTSWVRMAVPPFSGSVSPQRKEKSAAASKLSGGKRDATHAETGAAAAGAAGTEAATGTVVAAGAGVSPAVAG